MTGPPDRPLFDAYPALRERVPFVPLAELPTPLERMDRLSAGVGAELWVKRDGLTHTVYGGNKIRKFEFVFADVLRRKARAVITGGGLGSHHSLATAVMARQFDLQPVCSYYCQPLTDEVYHNLHLSAPLGIDAHFCGDYVGLAVSFAWQYVHWLLRTHRPPYFVYPGASSTLGTLGYVNAAFEIKAQLEEIGVPHPDQVFVAAGSCRTLAGLILGVQLAGLTSRILGVRIIERDVANRSKIARLVNRAARYLRRRDPTVPQVRIGPEQVHLLDGYMGHRHASPTAEAQKAADLVARAEGLPLDPTYTGKAMAALLDHVAHHRGERLLFIDTFAEEPTLEEGDYHDLPEPFWTIFDPGRQAPCWCLRSWRDPSHCWKSSSSGTVS